MYAILTSQLGESRYLKAESKDHPSLIIHYTECDRNGCATEAEMHANLAGMYAMKYDLWTTTNYFIGAETCNGYVFVPNTSTLLATKQLDGLDSGVARYEELVAEAEAERRMNER